MTPITKTMDTPARRELAAIETDSRFFSLLLLGAGLAVAIAVAGTVIGHVGQRAGKSPVAQTEAAPTQPA